MTATDIEGVARTRLNGWRHAYQGLVPQELLDGMKPERFAARLRATLPQAGADRAHFVADARGTGIVGWAHTGPYRPDENIDGDIDEVADGRGSCGELYAIYVRPEVLGAGVGRALMGASQRWLATRGHGRMRLWVLRDNALGRRFYDRAGLAPDGVERTVEMGGAPVDEVRYARALDGVPLA